jgi:hypothetical protein
MQFGLSASITLGGGWRDGDDAMTAPDGDPIFRQ